MTQTADGALTPRYRMDIVPYITGVSTSLDSLKKNNPSVYSRTAKGHYPLYAAGTTGETVTLTGFNLGATTTITISDSTVSGDYNHSFYVDTDGDAGDEYFEIISLNNKNNNDSYGSAYESLPDTGNTGNYSIYNEYFYNRQPNNDNNNLLTDDVVLDVWEFKDAAISQTSGYITEPVMKINPKNGMVNFGFNNGPANYSMANGQDTSFTTWVANYARFSTCGFTVDENGNTHGITVGLDTNPGNSMSAGRMTYLTNLWGTSQMDTNGNYEGKNSSRIDNIGAPAGTYNGVTFDGALFIEDRFASPSLATAVHGDDTYVFLAYYDDLNAEIRFKYGNLSDAYYGTNTNNTSVSGHIGITFGQFADQMAYGLGEKVHTAFDSNKKPEYYSSIAEPGTTAKAGNYVSIDVIKGASATEDVIIATWYDATNTAWYYSYKKNPCTDNDMGSGTGDGYWNTPIKLKDDAGENCQITVDSKGGVHIAAYDGTNADLLYAYLSSYDDSTPQVVTVDSYAFVGTNIRLDTAVSSDGNYVVPYIGYYMSSIQKPKLAKLTGLISASTIKATREAVTIPAGVDSSTDAVTGSWECTVLPSSSRFADNYAYSYVNVGVWKDADTGIIKNSVKGTTTYTNQSGLGKTNTGTVYGNGTANPVLGYATRVGTRGHLETAQMR